MSGLFDVKGPQGKKNPGLFDFDTSPSPPTTGGFPFASITSTIAKYSHSQQDLRGAGCHPDPTWTLISTWM
jgi:hypothetical protein